MVTQIQQIMKFDILYTWKQANKMCMDGNKHIYTLL